MLDDILDNFDEEVIKLLKRNRGWDDSIICYTNSRILGNGKYELEFEWQFVDENLNERTLPIILEFNIQSILGKSWIDKAAKLPENIPADIAVKLKLAYISYKTWNDLEGFFDENTWESWRICEDANSMLLATVHDSGITYQVRTLDNLKE